MRVSESSDQHMAPLFCNAYIGQSPYSYVCSGPAQIDICGVSPAIKEKKFRSWNAYLFQSTIETFHMSGYALSATERLVLPRMKCN